MQNKIQNLDTIDKLAPQGSQYNLENIDFLPY